MATVMNIYFWPFSQISIKIYLDLQNFVKCKSLKEQSFLIIFLITIFNYFLLSIIEVNKSQFSIGA